MTKIIGLLTSTVIEIGKIHFEGNIIPHQWYQHIVLESGKPDLPAIIILAEIIYWYRPYQTLDKSGKPLLRKHFDGDMFQCTAAYFESKFGLTKDQVRKALKRLEDAGYIRREYRDIVQQGILRNNIMFIEPISLAIMAITHPVIATDKLQKQPDTLSPTGDTLSPTGDTLSPTGDTLSPTGDTLSPTGDIFKGIKITTEISTETTTTTTTPYPSSSNERTAKTETAQGSGSGVQDENLKDPDSDHGIAALEPTKEKPVSREEVLAAATTGTDSNTSSNETPNEQRVELIFPTKLSDAEHEDIAAQVYPLPPDVAQQMLDALQAKVQSGQIRTNPAAVLRGIVRKYRTDPSAFDPSSGFQIAEARRRRAEADTRALAEAERRELERKQRNAARTSPESTNARQRFLKAALSAIGRS